MSFLPKYLATAVIGTAVVYCAAPFAAKNILADGQTADQPAPETQGNGAQAVADIPDNPERPDVPGPDVRGGTPHLQNSSTPTPNSQPSTPDEPEVIVENVRGYTPSTEVIRPSGNDVKYWGVSIADTALYDRDGKVRQEKLPGGTLIEQTDAKSSSIGEMAICRVWLKGQWAGSFLVSTADLIRFDGGREEVDAKDVANLCHYYALAAIVERRKEDLKQKAASANPYYAELKRKATAYNANVKRAEELTAKRDQAKGAERTKIIAELTKLKNSESRDATEVKQLTQKYEEWKKSHPATGTSNADRDPVIQGYERQMNELKGRLEMFGI